MISKKKKTNSQKNCQGTDYWWFWRDSFIVIEKNPIREGWRVSQLYSFWQSYRLDIKKSPCAAKYVDFYPSKIVKYLKCFCWTNGRLRKITKGLRTNNTKQNLSPRLSWEKYQPWECRCIGMYSVNQQLNLKEVPCRGYNFSESEV